MKKLIQYVVVCLFIVMLPAAAMAQGMDIPPPPGGNKPPAGKTPPPTNTAKPPATETAKPPPTDRPPRVPAPSPTTGLACGGFGEVTPDLAKPDEKRCRTADEWWALKLEPTKEKIAKEEGDKAFSKTLVICTIVILLSLAFIIGLVIWVRSQLSYMRVKMNQMVRLGTQNKTRLDELGASPAPNSSPPAAAAPAPNP